MAKRPIGEANIKVSVDGAGKVKSDLDGIKAQTESVGESGRKGFGKIDSAVGKVGKRIEDSTEGLRRFQGAVSGIIGVVGGLVAIGVAGFRKISGEIKEAREAAEAFDESMEKLKASGKEAIETISNFGRSADTLTQLEQQLEEQKRLIIQNAKESTEAAQKEYEEADPFNPLLEGVSRRKFERELKKINEQRKKDLEALSEAAAQREKEIRQQLAEEAYQEEERRLNEIGRERDELERQTVERARELRLSMLSEVEQAEEELARTQANIREQMALTGESRRIEQLKEILRLETQVGQAKIDAAKRAEQEGSNARLIKSMDDLARAVQEQAKNINDNNRELERLRQQVTNFTPALKKTAEGVTRRQRNT